MTKAEITSKIIDYLKEEKLIIKEQEQLLSNSWKRPTIDFSIYQATPMFTDSDRDSNALLPSLVEVPFCIVIRTSSGNEGINLTYAKRVIKRIIQDSAFWFGIIVDKNIHLYSYSEEKATYEFSTQPLNIEDVFDLIQKFLKKKFNKDNFKSLLKEALESINPQTKQDEIIVDAIKGSIAEAYFTQYGRTVTISLKNQFMLVSDILKRMGIKTSNEFCRYTSSGSLHRIIQNRKESMCGLAVMNDRSEGFFLDKCISPATSYNIWTHPQYEIDEYNCAFITSLCDVKKADDLTMWRLYGGDDGDGVCLIYGIDTQSLRNSSNLLLMPVLYGNKNNPIIQLFRVIQKLPYIMGFQFVLSYKNIFRYFVKPAEFKIEEECRLLLIRDQAVKSKLAEPKWIFNERYCIFHPLQELELASKNGERITSPLVLKKIILGPKSKETKVNVVQLRSWLNQLGLSGINVEESSINFYR